MSNKKNTNELLKLGYSFNFNFSFDSLCSIIKDIHTMGELLNFFKKKCISDVIILQGDKTFSKDTFFYFKYKQLISLYFKTINFFETDYFLRIEYQLYKTKPKFFSIFFIFNLHYIDEDLCQLFLEIHFENINLNKLIFKRGYKEFLENCKILSSSIQRNKIFEFCNANLLINSDYDLIMNITTHYTLFKLFLPNFKSISCLKQNNEELEKNNNGKLTNEMVLNIFLKKKKKYEYSTNNVIIKVEKFKSLENFCFLKYKILQFGKLKKLPFYFINVLIRKITNNHTFVSLKLSFNSPYPKKFIISIENYLNQILINLKDICSYYTLKNNNKLL